MATEYLEAASVFKALSDEKRLKILEKLRESEKCACVLLEYMNIGQSGLSYHMKILCDSGIVIGRQEGKWTYYKISESGSKYACMLLAKLTTPNTERTNI